MQNNTTNSLIGSKELRERLPHGGVQMIAQKHNVSWTWAYNVISGIVTGNVEIIEDAIRLAERNEQLKSAL